MSLKQKNNTNANNIFISMVIAVFLFFIIYIVSCYGVSFFSCVSGNCSKENSLYDYSPSSQCCHLNVSGGECNTKKINISKDASPSYLSGLIKPKPITHRDMKIAEIAWKYFENNSQKNTGLVNSVDKYASTTMWDTGSSLAGMIAARELCLLSQKEFDDMVVPLLSTLSDLDLYKNIAPNKAYNTKSGGMVDYRNKPSIEGIGVSTLDLARIVSWLNALSIAHPKYTHASREVLRRWNYNKLINKCQMYGYATDPVSKKIMTLQEGRLGYEQYAGKIFDVMGFSVDTSKNYMNKYSEISVIYDIPILYDRRDPRVLGAYNYVVTESYVLDIFENGEDAINSKLMDNIYEVQRQRWIREGIVTAVSEDNIDKKPWFIYNTIFSSGIPWNTITDRGVIHDGMKSTSTKAAIGMMTLYPDNPYSDVLYQTIESAYHPEKGWYSGVYENSNGFNKAITANTNGIILQSILYKMYGSFFSGTCELCRGESFAKEVLTESPGCNKCITCNSCEKNTTVCSI